MVGLQASNQGFRWRCRCTIWSFEAGADGGAFERRSLPMGFDTDAFSDKSASTPFVLSGAWDETTAIGDMTCYAHPLWIEDVARLYGK